MSEYLLEGWHELLGREHGPLTFRLVLQPLMALLFAIRSGLRDAREGRSAFFWTMVTHSSQRRYLLQEGWKDIGKLIILAIVLDAAYQLIVMHWVHVPQLLIVAFVLAVFPYLLARGLTNRIFRQLRAPRV